MDVRKESHVAAALKYIEENLPVGEEGLYGLVNNAGVSFLLMEKVMLAWKATISHILSGVRLRGV